MHWQRCHGLSLVRVSLRGAIFCFVLIFTYLERGFLSLMVNLIRETKLCNSFNSANILLNRRICSTFIFLFVWPWTPKLCYLYTIFIHRTHKNPYWVNNIDGLLENFMVAILIDGFWLYLWKTIAIRQSINISNWTNPLFNVENDNIFHKFTSFELLL